ncbi:Glu/Leu/Phe/Val dehydrogenase [Rhodospirillaceae bacterium KN72]|uniref:Glu/Leu/Phe/Val dehydrogenase n=1 Tax=Pacificispira spongiicola TaxID=2729598 RepID=A0A7Y0HG93_9PROT|nr:Glu/Leu/Phe/Val dehydrogenase [Pacificispira spongiicola]NMM44677.1 Glu/Leu/Phe/Val dehydrogenase [Pacificispira spongiicola]
MSVFSSPSFDEHEDVAFHYDGETGLKAIISLHSTVMGPALGGCRMWAYDDDAAALTDVLRLSRGMTFKNALADLPWGGGKSVIIGNAKTDKTPAMMREMGRFVDSFGGRYIVAEDVGTTPEDMAEIAKTTRNVRGVKSVGFDPSPGTAYGVFKGLEAAVGEALGASDLKGVRVAVQGLGHVGYDLARRLHAAGAVLTVTDIDAAALARAERELGATVVGLDAIYDADVDVYAPCALGATLNDDTIPRLKASIVAGAANNQLAETRHGDRLADRGILYAPDYVLNAGGVIHIYHEGPDFDRDATFAHIGRIGGTMRDIFRRAKDDGIPPHIAADRLAKDKLAAAKAGQRKANRPLAAE